MIKLKHGCKSGGFLCEVNTDTVSGHRFGTDAIQVGNIRGNTKETDIFTNIYC